MGDYFAVTIKIITQPYKIYKIQLLTSLFILYLPFDIFFTDMNFTLSLIILPLKQQDVSQSVCACSLTPLKRLNLMSWNFEG